MVILYHALPQGITRNSRLAQNINQAIVNNFLKKGERVGKEKATLGRPGGGGAAGSRLDLSFAGF